jgi:DNA-binding MarR family transcriptional regulator
MGSSATNDDADSASEQRELTELTELIDGLAQSAFQTMTVLTRIAAENDLSLTQLRALAILRDRRLRMTDLVDHLGLEKSTLTGLIARAEARGLVERAPNAVDKRAVDVFLSTEGHRLARRIEAELTLRLQPMVSALHPAERRTLAELLTKTVDTGSRP